MSKQTSQTGHAILCKFLVMAPLPYGGRVHRFRYLTDAGCHDGPFLIVKLETSRFAFQSAEIEQPLDLLVG